MFDVLNVRLIGVTAALDNVRSTRPRCSAPLNAHPWGQWEDR
jgi:hypothetical protein